MVESVIQLPAELEGDVFLYREILEDREIPFVDSGPAEHVFGRFADSSQSGGRERARVEVSIKSALAGRQDGICRNHHSRTIAPSSHIRSVDQAIVDAHRRAIDERSHA